MLPWPFDIRNRSLTIEPRHSDRPNRHYPCNSGKLLDLSPLHLLNLPELRYQDKSAKRGAVVMDDQNKNLILATALSFLVILTWFILFPPEEPVPTSVPDAIVAADRSGLATPDAVGPATATGDIAVVPEAAPEAARLPIMTSHLTGSI